jgi:citrate lyase subunit beta / citryl-CoA lyase
MRTIPTPPARWASLLFIPSDQPRKLARGRESRAAALILDWEDSVCEPAKRDARKLALDFLRSKPDFPGSIFIRVNANGSRHFSEDCAALREFRPNAIVIPKCRSARDVQRLASFLSEVDSGKACHIVPLIESAVAVVNCSAILASSDRVIAAGFGAEDFSADMQITRSAGEPELLYARCVIATACRAAGIEPLDSPFLDYRDTQGLRTAAAGAAHLGFTGKLAIHPAQIPVLNEVFSPSAGELEAARRLVEAFESANAAVAGIEGRMIDEAVIKRARRLLDLFAKD